MADGQTPEETPAETPRSRGVLTAFYVGLALLTAVVAVVTISAGSDTEPRPEIAGGYDVARDNACVGGETFEVLQSGEFVNFTTRSGDFGGKLRLGEGEDRLPLTGDLTCANGDSVPFEGTATPGDRGSIQGRLGGQSLAATLERDPPEPGPKPRSPGSIAGEYRSSPRSVCLGGLFAIEEHEGALELESDGRVLGELEYVERTGAITGETECLRGGEAEVSATATDRNLTNFTITPAEGQAVEESGLPEGGERFTATQQRESFGITLAVFFLAVAVVMLVARLFGMAAVKLGQPRVMGEVVAGIALGPTILGAIAPGLQAALFPSDILVAFGVAANLGLIFYMFLVGMELDPEQLKGRISQAALISNTSVALPMMLGLAVAVPVYGLVGPDDDFLPFALFMGVAMSITAFPVLARILVERRMLKRPVGAIAIACAAIDDVTAWFLIALATAVAVAGSVTGVIRTILLAIAFCLVMGLLVRPLVGRVSTAYDEVGRIPGGWVVAIFAGVLLSAFATEMIGIAIIFGAFVMGMVMPRHAGLTEDVTHRIEDFVVTLLLPMFFAYTGLRTNIGLLDRPELWLLTLLLIAVAIVGKLVGAAVAARVAGFGTRPALVIGTLMNTRGLTELIVLNLALEKGVISEALFAMLVIMALVTTFMAGPLLKLLDPRNELGAPVEEELEAARRQSATDFPELPVPDRSILVAPQGEAAALVQLRALAEPLARSEPPRELILARLVRPPGGAAVRGGLQTENRALREASEEVTLARLELIEEQIAARGVAFISADPGSDLARLAGSEEVDLTLLDGRRPLLGEGVPRGDVGTVLREAPSDVAVLVAPESQVVVPGPDRAVVVPFGGAEHDWAALELGAWMAAATQAPLRLLGAAGQEDSTRVTRLLGDAGLLVQQYAGIPAQPVVAEPGREGVMAAAADAGLLIIGLSDRWREEGLGPTRSEIARAAPAPVLFVRRGTRPGALAPRSDVTRFQWSLPGMGAADQGYTPGGPIR